MFYFSGSAEARRAHGDPRRIRFRSETRSDRQGRLAQIHGLQNNRLSAYIEFFKSFFKLFEEYRYRYFIFAAVLWQLCIKISILFLLIGLILSGLHFLYCLFLKILFCLGGRFPSLH